MSTNRNEWERRLHEQKVGDDERNEQWTAYWKLQEEERKQIDALRLKVILEEKLIPQDGWELEQPRGHEFLAITHQRLYDHEVWKPLIEMWTEADYHSSIVIQGDEYVSGVVLRVDDSVMSMKFRPPIALPKFMQSYGLRVDPGEVGEYRAGLVSALEGIDKLLEMLK